MMIRFVEGRTACQDVYIPKAVLRKDGTELTAMCPEGTGARYVRIRLSPGQGIAEVAVWPADAL